MSDKEAKTSDGVIVEGTTISLECGACKKPLSFYLHKDGSKTLGCFDCFERPVITHPNDWNKIMEKLELLT